jgi:1,4-alpha-glucan branching enzyme
VVLFCGQTFSEPAPEVQGYVSLILHAHLPFTRHPEHERFLEESWLFEAVIESYIPLLQTIEGWRRDGMDVPLTLTLSPTLCSMLTDSLLQQRITRRLEALVDLSEQELHRTLWLPPLQDLAEFYRERFRRIRDSWKAWNGDLVAAFGSLQERGRLEIITCAATHAVLPLMVNHPPSLRAQVQVARDHYHSCFGRDPRGIWLPECAWSEELGPVLAEAGLRWFVTDSHGLLKARPRPRSGTFAPAITPDGLAAFGRDQESAKQVWSRHGGYPGDERYRDFYRDIGFDLDLDYVERWLPAPGRRGFTGIKYHSIAGGGQKRIYDRSSAIGAANGHAAHFLGQRIEQIRKVSELLDSPPIIVAPYDAELFGHWWYEGPEFLDLFVRKAWHDQKIFDLITPDEYLTRHPSHSAATPAASSWGEEGYWRVWLNEKTEWIFPHLSAAQQRMSNLAQRFQKPDSAEERALRQAGRELLLAQASDWPFILRTGSSPDYARRRVREHLASFGQICQLLERPPESRDYSAVWKIEERDNLFQELEWRYWRPASSKAS